MKQSNVMYLNKKGLKKILKKKKLLKILIFGNSLQQEQMEEMVALEICL